MLRSLTYYRRLSLSLLLGAATASAVLTGALLVGDSVRGSLRDLALERLGETGVAILPGRFIPESLANAIASTLDSPAIAPVILLRGSGVHPDTRARATGVSVVGVTDAFAELFPGGKALFAALWSADGRSPFPRVVINRSLARALGADVGDPVLLRMPRPQDAPAETLLGRRDEESLIVSLRATVVAVIEDAGAGAFTLAAHQSAPLNAFVRLPDLQRAAAIPGRINLLLVATGSQAVGEDLEDRLRQNLSLEAMGLVLREGTGHITVESARMVLSPELSALLAERGRSLGATTQRIQTYLATAITRGSVSIPYSTITAADPNGSSVPWLVLTDGGIAPALSRDEIDLNEWTAHQLGASEGDSIQLEYFVVDAGENLITRTAQFRLAGIVRMEGFAADRTLTPEFPGIKGARDIASWDPPFPVALAQIRAEDEQYWDTWGSTPKAFVAPETGRALWSNRYGTDTSVRMAPPPGVGVREFAATLSADLARSLPLAPLGLSPRLVRKEALEAGTGATDFGGLFLGFSLFLILSAALLCALLMLLSIETRAREIGLLLAVGWSRLRVRRRFLREGMAIALCGTLAGLAGGMLYARLLLAGLQTLWRPAVGTRSLSLHVGAWSLPLAAAISLIVLGVSLLLSLRRLSRADAASLLSGAWVRPARNHGTARPRWVALSAFLAAAGLTGLALAGRSGADAALAFGAGAAMLIGAIALFAAWQGSGGSGSALARSSWPLITLAARNTGWNRGRSLLSVALVASASFVILTVAASRRDSHTDGSLSSGSGGYDLVGQSEIPLHHDLATSFGRLQLGLGGETGAALERSVITAFRSVPGDDASCLNLFRTERPRLLGVPASQVARGGFSFAATSRSVENPWTLLNEPLEPGVIPAFGDENSVVWILHSGLGEEITVTDEAGRPLRLRFVGLLAGSIFQSEVLISEANLLNHYPGRAGRDWLLIDAPPGEAKRLASGLEEALASRGFDAEPAADRLAAFHAVENTYLSTFLVLGGLGLLLGTLGLGIAVTRNVMERRGELAGMRAFGWPRKTLARMVLLENAVLMLCGLAAGALAAGLAVAPRLAAGQVNPPLIPLLLTLSGVGISGLLAGAVAARGVLRAPLIPALRAER